jgi:hypothetical protein
MYETSEPRDVVYSPLPISKDAFRFNLPQDGEATDVRATVFDHLPIVEKVVESWVDRHIVQQAFKVDYDAAVLGVYKQLISFSISKAERPRSLDIICHPWAPDLRDMDFPYWISTLAHTTCKLVDQNEVGRRPVRHNPDSLVGNPDAATYNASMNIGPLKSLQVFRYCNSVDLGMFLRGFVLDEIRELEFLHSSVIFRLSGSNWLSGIPNMMYDPRNSGERSSPTWVRMLEILTFYRKACRDVFQHAMDDTLDTAMLIYHGISTTADFLKRVQVVIWNRRLMRTRRLWLGLAPKSARNEDLVLYPLWLQCPGNFMLLLTDKLPISTAITK